MQKLKNVTYDNRFSANNVGELFVLLSEYLKISHDKLLMVAHARNPKLNLQMKIENFDAYRELLDINCCFQIRGSVAELYDHTRTAMKIKEPLATLVVSGCAGVVSGVNSGLSEQINDFDYRGWLQIVSGEMDDTLYDFLKNPNNSTYHREAKEGLRQKISHYKENRILGMAYYLGPSASDSIWAVPGSLHHAFKMALRYRKPPVNNEIDKQLQKEKDTGLQKGLFQLERNLFKTFTVEAMAKIITQPEAVKKKTLL